MNMNNLRRLASSLIIIGGIAHLVIIILYPQMETVSNILFGIFYILIGAGLLIDNQLFNYLGVGVPLIGAFLAMYYFVFINSEIILLPLIIIDILVVLLCLYLIV